MQICLQNEEERTTKRPEEVSVVIELWERGFTLGGISKKTQMGSVVIKKILRLNGYLILD